MNLRHIPNKWCMANITALLLFNTTTIIFVAFVFDDRVTPLIPGAGRTLPK